ncbi:MAG: tetratricopeptide repeat protein [Chloroflexi bacterium]|nr:tetratricopeptide repeat protein [Chloroflexota bacterium]
MRIGNNSRDSIGSPTARGGLDVDALLDKAIRILITIFALNIVGLGAYWYFDRNTLNSPSSVDRTIQDLEALVVQEPNNANLRTQMALAYMERRRLDAAVEQFQTALVLAPDHQTALVGLGNALLAANDDPSALAAFERVAELNRDNPYRKTLRQLEGIYYRIALIRARHDDLEGAQANLLEALDIDSTDADAWFLLGEVRRRSGQPHLALEAYRKAANMVPTFAQVYEAMATVFSDMERPDLVDYARGMVAVARADYQRALPLLQRATEASPNNADAYLGLGQAHEHLGHLSEAQVAYETAMRLDHGQFLSEMFLNRVRDRQRAQEVPQ